MSKRARAAVTRLLGKLDRLSYRCRVGIDADGKATLQLSPDDLLRSLGGLLRQGALVASFLEDGREPGKGV